MAGEPGGPGCPTGPCGPAGPMGPPLPGSPFIPCSTNKTGESSQTLCRDTKSCLPADGCACTTGASPACLSFLVGLWVLYFLRFQVLPLDPFHPAQKKKKINPTLNLSSGKSLLCYLYLFMASLSVQACLGNPSHPVEREEQMGCSAGTCTA